MTLNIAQMPELKILLQRPFTIVELYNFFMNFKQTNSGLL